MAKLVVSAFADEYSDNFTEQLEALKRLGIDYIELRRADGKNVSELDKSDVADIKSRLKSFGIKVSSIGSPLGKIKLDGDMEAHLNTARRVFETAAELGAGFCRVFSFYLPDGKSAKQCRGGVLSAMEKLLRLSEEYGVTLCHENEALIYGESPQNCLDLAEYFGGRLKCVLDMGNFVLDGYNPYEAYKLLFRHIAYFHIKDALYAGAVVPAGKGEAQIEYILNDYRVRGKGDTFITLEPHLQTFAGLNALVGKNFENPYKYETPQQAFIDAYEKLRGLI